MLLPKNTTYYLDHAEACAETLAKRLVEAHFFNKPLTTLFCWKIFQSTSALASSIQIAYNTLNAVTAE